MNCWSLLICSEVTEPLRCHSPHLDWGTVLSTNKKMAFSEGSWMRFLMIHMNWATVMSEGTRYFLLSMSTICDPDTFSTITWQETRRDNDYSRHATKQIFVNLLRCLWDVTHRDPVRVLVADFGGLYASMFWWTEKTTVTLIMCYSPVCQQKKRFLRSDFLFCTDTRRGAVMDEIDIWTVRSTAAVD